jgi:hypothetical protein
MLQILGIFERTQCLLNYLQNWVLLQFLLNIRVYLIYVGHINSYL